MSLLPQFDNSNQLIFRSRKSAMGFSEIILFGQIEYEKVYKGELHHLTGQTTVAFKRLNLIYGPGEPDYWKELSMHSRYRHQNIQFLLGFTDHETGEKVLVYEYASKGGLDFHLNNNDLTWVQRLKICVGVARGLAYLHHATVGAQQRVFYRNIKSSNILLDENWDAKISGLELFKFGSADDQLRYILSNPIETMGYRDPLYVVKEILTNALDTYALGVVLFEVLCGRLCTSDNNNNKPLIALVRKFYEENNLEEIIYDSIKDEMNPSSLKAFATIAYQCLKEELNQRPLMHDVVRNLESALTYQIFTEGLKIDLKAIQFATNNFADDRCIGRGGFGEVYKGKLIQSEDTLVALKRLNRAFGQGNPEFWKEVNMLSRYRHENIVNLLGYCNECNEKILVYEYVSRKSLDFSLSNSDLTWIQRLKICIGAARGLAYLHDPDGNQESVWHLDIKSGNILLDDNWNAKIADLGLSMFGHVKQEYNSGNQNVAGTVGYCDPVYIETRFPSKESDVYSFGVVLFEVLCGRLCISKGHRSLTILAEWCYEQNNLNPIIYGNIKHEISPSSLRVFTTIAYRCLRRERRERPLMKEIVEALETALEYQIPPLPRTLTNSSSSNEYHRPLKPLHWEKTHALVGSLWDVSHNEGIQSRAPEIDISELESLFCKHKYRAHPGYEQHEPENTRLVHPERASDCEIVLHKIKLPVSDLMGAILQLDSHAVTVDQVYNLIEICPTNEEMEMLKSYTGDKEKLGQCEQFFLECAKIPRIKPKLLVFAFIITFRRRANNLRDTLNTIKEAIKEIKESTKLVKIMQIILVIGNKLNAGTTKESYTGFKLQSLEKLGDTCATDVNITLLHFLCKVVAEQTPELLDFYEDLIHLQDAYWVHIRSLYEDKSAMIEGFKKVQQECDASANDDGVSNPFRKALRRFLDSTGTELPRLTSFFDEVDLYAESLVVYFGEDPSHCSWKQVISSLGHFIEMFKKAHNQNKRWRDAKKNKSHETVKKSQVHITSMKIKPT